MLFVTRLKIAATVLAAFGLATAGAAALATQAANIALRNNPLPAPSSLRYPSPATKHPSTIE